MTTQRQFSLAIPVLAGLAFISSAFAQQAVDFNRDIRPILSNKCFACHGPDEGKRQAGLRLDDAKIATGELESGATAIVPGNPEASELIRRVTNADEAQRMPPAEFGKPLSTAEIATLRKWIEQGARYATHWSYVKPVRTAPPAAAEAWQHWPRNAIDLFALQAMLAHGLHPSPEADRYALARRVFLDLTGLPPTIEEADAFVEDEDPQAYEKLVDDLLHRPTYGEHWARMWLDLARYADSAGYADDPPRTIWAYRDWVIKAINENKPFDQFTIEQIAGDLLPNPSDDQLIATAFHRNTMTNNEGGTQDEEFRNAAVVDRVNTTMAVWMGTTMACAQCHNHKYDPISQHEYFQLFAILNNTQDADRNDESPVLAIFTDAAAAPAGRVAGPHCPCCKRSSARPPMRSCTTVTFWLQAEAALRGMQAGDDRADPPRTDRPASRNPTSVSRQLSRQGSCGRTGFAGRISCCRGGRAARPAESGTLAC